MSLAFATPEAFVSFFGRVPRPTVMVGHGGRIAEKEITVNDVLLGRGSALDNHNGNKQLRFIVLQTAITNRNKTYVKKEKTFEAAKVVATVRNLNPPGRFLSKNEGAGFWEEVGDLKARKKVAQAFRDFKYAAKKKADPIRFSKSNDVRHSSHSEEKIFCQSLIKNLTVAGNAVPSNHAIQNFDVRSTGYHNYPESATQKEVISAHRHPGSILLHHFVPETLSNYDDDKSYIQNRIALDAAKIASQTSNLNTSGRFKSRNKETGNLEEAGEAQERVKVSRVFCELHNAMTKKASAGFVSQPKDDQFEEKLSGQGLTSNDVLLGRGNHKHHGNIQFRHLVAQHLTEYYDKANIKDKNALIYTKIVAMIRTLDPPGRFMHQNKRTGCWEEVGDLTAFKKVARAFLDLCHPAK